jgi:hypothetical protein
MPLPLIIVAALVVLVLLGKQSKAAGSSSATVTAPTGPSTPNGSWNPAEVPTYIHPYAVDPVGTGTYGGNEADPRIAGGSWFDDRFGGRCTYDPKGGPSGQGATTCDKPIPCEVAGTCWQNLTNPFKALGPPPPPPK